ncbi:MAG TPA: photosynthetic reaction center cytochrome c subunit family protein [Terriglobia bacterium]|nr:photosynthetic reaction center cytochrome c subunit family protein [Terriglobia bacterium]
MKQFTVLLVLCLVAAMSLALFAQENQTRGGQVPPTPGAEGGRGGDVAPPAGGPAGARGGQRAGGGGGGGGAARGGGGGPKNVQVLIGADLPNTMQSFVQALGLLEKGTCSHCHVEDRSSDEKKPKQVARRMITMTRAINATFPDGKPHVTCYTCHRGNTKPPMEPELPGLGQ